MDHNNPFLSRALFAGHIDAVRPLTSTSDYEQRQQGAWKSKDECDNSPEGGSFGLCSHSREAQIREDPDR